MIDMGGLERATQAPRGGPGRPGGAVASLEILTLLLYRFEYWNFWRAPG